MRRLRVAASSEGGCVGNEGKGSFFFLVGEAVLGDGGVVMGRGGKLDWVRLPVGQLGGGQGGEVSQGDDDCGRV